MRHIPTKERVLYKALNLLVRVFGHYMVVDALAEIAYLQALEKGDQFLFHLSDAFDDLAVKIRIPKLSRLRDSEPW